MRALAFLLMFASAVPAFSQGTVNFANGAAGVNAPVTNFSVTPFVLASGPGFQAQLYVGPAGITDMNLLTTNGVSGSPQSFATGGSAGFFFGGTRTIDGFLPGTIVTLQVRAWATSAGSSWETASLTRGAGESNLIQVSLGGGAIPTPNLVGLQGFGIAVLCPEPSSLALAALGLAMVGFCGMRRTH